MPSDGRLQRMAGVALAGLAALAVAGGLWLAGGPAQGRKERRDEARADDLNRLSQHIACLATDGAMPADLAETGGCPGPVRRADPFTDAPYRVEPLPDGKYRLCAGFELPPVTAPWSGMNLRDGDCMVFDLPRRDAPGTVPGPAP